MEGRWRPGARAQSETGGCWWRAAHGSSSGLEESAQDRDLEERVERHVVDICARASGSGRVSARASGQASLRAGEGLVGYGSGAAALAVRVSPCGLNLLACLVSVRFSTRLQRLHGVAGIELSFGGGVQFKCAREPTRSYILRLVRWSLSRWSGLTASPEPLRVSSVCRACKVPFFWRITRS